MSFTIKGRIFDHNSNPVNGVYIDAFHLNIFLSSFLRLPFCLDLSNRVFLGIKNRESDEIFSQYLGTAGPTTDGTFELTFPRAAYSLFPNIKLTIRNDHRILYDTPTSRIINTRLVPSSNNFTIKIPQEKFRYSDQISHVDLMTLLRDIVDDTTNFSFDEFIKMWQGLAEPLEDSKYLKKKVWEKLNYNRKQGALVPAEPKSKIHDHNIPWDSDPPSNSKTFVPNDAYMPRIPYYDDLKPPKICGLENIPNRTLPYGVVTKDIVENADVCVIGSGAAGAILASELANDGKKVILIEKGGYYESEDFNQRESTMMPLLWKNGGFNFTESGLVIAQGQCLGGSTVINDAVCFEPPKNVLKQWWQLIQNDSGSYRYAEQEWLDKWGSSNSSGSAIYQVWNNKLQISKVKEEELNSNNKKLKQACLAMNYECDNNHRNSVHTDQCGFCHLGCHYERKQDVVRSYIHDIITNNKNITIFCNCDVEKITYNNNMVSGVEGKFEEVDGTEKFKLRVNAKVVILSAGSIASSALLISNNIAIGKAGHGLALHPSTLLVAKFNEEIKASEGIPMAFSCTHFSVARKQGTPPENGGFMLESIFTPIYQFALQLPQKIPDNNGGTMNPMDDFNHYAMAGIMLRDKPMGKISVSDSGRPRVEYNLGDNQFPMNSLIEGIDKLARLWIEKSGAPLVISGYNQNENEGRDAVIYRDTLDSDIKRIQDGIRKNPHKLKMGSAHPQGGNRMGENKNYCVVDSNCKVHDFHNLFVCDASVFPLAVGVNPQITVMSLATITANHIKEIWNQNFENIVPRDFQGLTASKKQLMYGSAEYLETIFYQTKMDTNFTTDDLVTPQNPLWSFDRESLVITNQNHWRGFIPEYRDYDFGERDFGMNTINVLKNFIAGFWKKFSKDSRGNIVGETHIYQFPNDNQKVKFFATKENYSIYGGTVIKLRYPSLLVNIYDIVKVIDENTVIGKAIFGKSPFGIELFTFCMVRKYPAQFMDLEDHEKIFLDYSDDIQLRNISGRWAVRDVKRNILDRRVIVNFDNNMSEESKINLLKKIVSTEIDEHLDNEIKKVNDIFYVGKLYSDWHEHVRWDISDYYIEESSVNGIPKKRICIRYVLTT